MAGSPVDTLLTAAKAEVRNKVLRDRKNRSPEVLRVLEAIAEDFFEPQFNVEHLERAGLVDWRIRERFRAELRMGIKAYLMDGRKSAAAWLLIKTDLPVKAIAGGLGYTRKRACNFSRDFKAWTGETPGEYRAARRGKLRAQGGWLERVVTEALREEPKRVVLPRGLYVYLAGDDDEEMAERVWAVLRDETPARQVELVNFEFFFAGPELFEVLSRVSREAGRRDRQLGVRLAEVAVAAVEGSRALLGERYADLYALALARLANAMVLTGDLVGADEVFQRVEKDCARPRAGRDKGIQGEILFLKGTLRLFQRRFSEARELLGTAIEVAETISDVGLHINARLQRAAAAGYEGRPNAMIPDLRAVAGLLRNQQNPDRLQMLCLYQDLTWAYLENGDIERAKAELPRAKALCEELGHTASGHQLQWIEGLSAKAQGELRDAERLFRQARDGFNESGDVYSLAIASLEIAILCQAQGRDGEVITLVTGEVLPVLESLALRSEALGAVTLLRNGVAQNEVSAGALEAVRHALFRIRTGVPGSC